MGVGASGCCHGQRKEKLVSYFSPKHENQKSFQYFLKDFQKEPNLYEVFVARQPIKLKTVENCCSLNTTIQLLLYKIEFVGWLNEYYALSLQYYSEKNRIMKVWMQFLAILRSSRNELASTAGFIDFFAEHSLKRFPIGNEVETNLLLDEMLNELVSCEEIFQEKTLSKLFVFDVCCSFECVSCGRNNSKGFSKFGIKEAVWDEGKDLETVVQAQITKITKELSFCPGCGTLNKETVELSFKLPHYFFISFVELVKMSLGAIERLKPIEILGKSYIVSELVAFINESTYKGHYMLIRHFENQGWRIIDSEIVDSFDNKMLLGESFKIKMLVLEQQ